MPTCSLLMPHGTPRLFTWVPMSESEKPVCAGKPIFLAQHPQPLAHFLLPFPLATPPLPCLQSCSFQTSLFYFTPRLCPGCSLCLPALLMASVSSAQGTSLSPWLPTPKSVQREPLYCWHSLGQDLQEGFKGSKQGPPEPKASLGI